MSRKEAALTAEELRISAIFLRQNKLPWPIFFIRRKSTEILQEPLDGYPEMGLSQASTGEIHGQESTSPQEAGLYD